MTDRPTELELAHLHQQMRLVKELAGEKRDPGHRCVYCGASCYGRACRQHRDLVQIENRMAAA